MRCATARTWLTRRLRESLVLAVDRRLEQHLARCPRCRAEAAATAALVCQLEREVREPAAIFHAATDARALAALLRRRNVTPRRFLVTPRLGTALALAGVIAVAAIGTLREYKAVSGGKGETLPRQVAKVGSSTLTRRPVPRRLKPRATKAQSPPSGTKVSVREGGLRAFVARGFSRRGDDDGLSAPGHRSTTSHRRRDHGPAADRAITPPGDDFVTLLPPRIAAVGPEGDRAAVEAAAAYRRERAVVDARLVRRVTLAVKAMALSDLCDQVRAETGIQLAAGPSVADEKVTVFCRDLPLRDVMRQVSRPFGYAWLRSGKPGEYRYELVQDLRSQLLEEELRNRDRNAALLALNEELGRFRQYLDLSPDEARDRARNATGEEKKRLERYATWGWGPLQIYARLTPADIAALRAGVRINFSGQPQEGERGLPADLERGVLESMRDVRLVKSENGFRPAREADGANSVPPVQVPEARGRISIEIDQDDLGKMEYDVTSGITGIYPGGRGSMHGGILAVGESPSVRGPENAAANRALVRDPALSPRITVTPRPAYRPAPDAQPADGEPSPARGYAGSLPAQPMVTTAEVLEAIHQATGLPLVADYYTRIYPASSLSAQNLRLFDALNRLGDTMRLRWRKDGEWLQFRSTSYFHDRLEEVPNRLLRRWAASRKQHGFLTLDDLCEIVGLSPAQLDAEEMAEGARVLYGLMEWALFPRRGGLRAYLKHLAEFTPAQRRQMQTPPGLFFSQMTLAQQKGFLTLALGPDGKEPARLEHLAGATMRVDYAVPGTFEWRLPSEEWRLLPDATSPFTAEALLPRVRERTREAALLAARQIDLQVSQAQIHPTEPALTILYLPGPGSPLSGGGIHVARTTEKRRMALPAP